MKAIYKRNDVIDWFDILEYLIDGKAVKIHCYNSSETLTLWDANNILVIQNNRKKTADIHNLQSMGVAVNGKLLEVLVDASLIENNVEDIAIIETVDFQITLVDLD